MYSFNWGNAFQVAAGLVPSASETDVRSRQTQQQQPQAAIPGNANLAAVYGNHDTNAAWMATGMGYGSGHHGQMPMFVYMMHPHQTHFMPSAMQTPLVGAPPTSNLPRGPQDSVAQQSVKEVRDGSQMKNDLQKWTPVPAKIAGQDEQLKQQRLVNPANPASNLGQASLQLNPAATPLPPPPSSPTRPEPPAEAARSLQDKPTMNPETRTESDQFSSDDPILSDEEFEMQLVAWNRQFENWRERYQNHPDRDVYRWYERQWQSWREQLLARCEQMRHLSNRFPNELGPGPSEDVATAEESTRIGPRSTGLGQDNTTPAERGEPPAIKGARAGPRPLMDITPVIPAGRFPQQTKYGEEESTDTFKDWFDQRMNLPQRTFLNEGYQFDRDELSQDDYMGRSRGGLHGGLRGGQRSLMMGIQDAFGGRQEFGGPRPLMESLDPRDRQSFECDDDSWGGVSNETLHARNSPLFNASLQRRGIGLGQAGRQLHEGYDGPGLHEQQPFNEGSRGGSQFNHAGNCPGLLHQYDDQSEDKDSTDDSYLQQSNISDAGSQQDDFEDIENVDFQRDVGLGVQGLLRARVHREPGLTRGEDPWGQRFGRFTEDDEMDVAEVARLEELCFGQSESDEDEDDSLAARFTNCGFGRGGGVPAHQGFVKCEVDDDQDYVNAARLGDRGEQNFPRGRGAMGQDIRGGLSETGSDTEKDAWSIQQKNQTIQQCVPTRQSPLKPPESEKPDEQREDDQSKSQVVTDSTNKSIPPSSAASKTAVKPFESSTTSTHVVEPVKPPPAENDPQKQDNAESASSAVLTAPGSGKDSASAAQDKSISHPEKAAESIPKEKEGTQVTTPSVEPDAQEKVETSPATRSQDQPDATVKPRKRVSRFTPAEPSASDNSTATSDEAAQQKPSADYEDDVQILFVIPPVIPKPRQGQRQPSRQGERGGARFNRGDRDVGESNRGASQRRRNEAEDLRGEKRRSDDRRRRNRDRGSTRNRSRDEKGRGQRGYHDREQTSRGRDSESHSGSDFSQSRGGDRCNRRSRYRSSSWGGSRDRSSSWGRSRTSPPSNRYSMEHNGDRSSQRGRQMDEGRFFQRDDDQYEEEAEDPLHGCVSFVPEVSRRRDNAYNIEEPGSGPSKHFPIKRERLDADVLAAIDMRLLAKATGQQIDPTYGLRPDLNFEPPAAKVPRLEQQSGVKPRVMDNLEDEAPLVAVGGTISRALTKKEQDIIVQTAENLKALHDLKKMADIVSALIASNPQPHSDNPNDREVYQDHANYEEYYQDEEWYRDERYCQEWEQVWRDETNVAVGSMEAPFQRDNYYAISGEEGHELERRSLSDSDGTDWHHSWEGHSQDGDRHCDHRERWTSKSEESKNKHETVLIEDLIGIEGRRKRPSHIVLILRGPPGSGKTYAANLIKDKEIEHSGGVSAIRMLCLDDYCSVELEQTNANLQSYKYDPVMADRYRKSLYKTFKKTVDNGFFPFIIVDAIHNKVKHFDKIWSYAKQNGFQVYIVEMDTDTVTCHERNIHNCSVEDIQTILKSWEPAPSHYLRVDIRSLLQDDAIPEVEMEDTVVEGEKNKQVE